MNYLWNAVSSHGNGFELLLFLAASTLKATLLLGFVAVLCLLLRRFSAATRHLLWTLSLCAALLLPFLSVAAVWEVPLLPAQVSHWNQAPSNQLAGTTNDASPSREKGIQQRVEVAPVINGNEPESTDFQTSVNAVEKTLPLATSSGVDAPAQKGSATFWSKLANWALAVWFAGAVLLLFRLVIGFMSTNLLTRGAVEFEDAKLTRLFSSLLKELQLTGRVRLLRSERTLMPIVCGVFRPVVLLPASADDWSEERSRMVLLHELTHVTRRDCLTQMLAQAACAFYWFNPFVWHAARRLRVEREQACDDYVLSIGTKPSDYAHHLLEIARYLQERSVFQWSQTATVAMARRSQLEGRLLAILSKEGKRRRAMSQMTTVGLTALLFLFFLTLAVVRPTVSRAQNPQLSESALNEETDAADKSLSGLFSATSSGAKDRAAMRGGETQEASEAQVNNAHTDDDSQEKSLDGAQADHDEQDLKTDDGRDVESELDAPAPPQVENFPTPPGVPEVGPTAMPFIKTRYQEERKGEARDKSTDFIDEMASVGYVNLSIDELVHLKSSGVTADYVRSLRSLGLGNLTTREIAGMSVNGITPSFVEAMRDAGYKELNARDLTSFRVHGITTDFISRLRKAGYSNLTARQLIEFAVHRVTPDFISQMRAVGLANLSARDLVTLRVHGVSPEFVREARRRLGDLNVRQIIALKIEGLIEGAGD
jgi:beta-lactamase regulating signal transducer with metallopeptidase domain